MSDVRYQRIGAYYDGLVDQYGHDPRACDASSRQSLEARYRVLSQVADLTGKSVLEIGCGFGDLGAFLTSRYERVDYLGIDLSHRMIEEGRKVNPGLRLLQANVLDLEESAQADVVLAQGIFYLLGADAEVVVYELIDKMFGQAREAVAFSTLSGWSPRQEPSEWYADPLRLLAFCRTLTGSLVLRHDYHPGDLTMYLYKETQA